MDNLRNNFKVGDRVMATNTDPETSIVYSDYVGEVGTITDIYNDSSYIGKVGTITKIHSGGRSCEIEYLGGNTQWAYFESDKIVKVENDDSTTTKVTPSGGPSEYYDMPFSDWVTTNDMMEYLAENKWGKYAIHLKDIHKGLCRWGDKEGTTVEYDARKFIYYGARVLRMIVGVPKTREYLKELLDNKQFGGDN